MRELVPLEARVLAVLVEKAHTVPDSYPLSLNALVLGCNQKTARAVPMAATEAEVQTAAAALSALSLVAEVSGARVTRYQHRMGHGLALPAQSVALLAMLVLRGPQTAAELRGACERVHQFADLSAVEGFLHELAERSTDKGGPLTVLLPRAPGSREARWAQLLCGPVDLAAWAAAGAAGAAGATQGSSVVGELAELRAEVDTLRALVERLYDELGVART
jgi:uncharacterized protein